MKIMKNIYVYGNDCNGIIIVKVITAKVMINKVILLLTVVMIIILTVKMKG